MKPSDLLKIVATFLEQHDIDYFVTGSMVTIAFGESRFTNDVDIVVDLRNEHVRAFEQSFEQGEFYYSTQAIRDAIRGRRQFNLIQPASGLKIDFMVRSPDDSEFDASRFARIVRYEPDPHDDYTANCSSLEDVFLKKMAYFKEGGSDKHLRDIASVFKIRASEIDRDYVRRWATELDVLDVWDMVLERVDAEREG